MAGPVGFIDVEIVGSRTGVQAMLNHLDSAMSPVGLAAFLHGAVEPWVKQRAEERFREHGDDATGRWQPLAQSTVEIRERGPWAVGGSSPINKRTGELERYITQSQGAIRAVPGAASFTYPENPPTTRSLQDKMKTAQKGRTHPATNPRPVLGLSERDLAVVMTQLAFHVQGWGGRK